MGDPKMKKHWLTKQLSALLSLNDKGLLKDFLEAYDVDLNSLKLNHKGHRALHVTCRSANWSLCNLLIAAGARPNVTDRKGNSAAYYALRSALHRSYLGSPWLTSIYKDVLEPMLRLMEGSMHIPNRKGKTTAQLLYKLEKHIVADVPEDDDSDEEWADRLANELEEEYNTEWGGFEQDFLDPRTHRQRETYDQWANRMFQEHQARRQRHRHATHARGDAPHSSKSDGHKSDGRKWDAKQQKEFEEKARREQEARENKRREFRLYCWNADYKNKCHILFAKGSSTKVGMSDLPFASGDSDKEMVEAILIGVPQGDAAARKKCLREQQLKWHPDKFMQICGGRLVEDQREAILQKVTAISQALNAISSM